ncbi:response regulator, partial [Citrobacter braakii]|uniref:response regulator n=1 Tax=Citrobacter braakii TaxID=57706 RepID=UPI001981617E
RGIRDTLADAADIEVVGEAADYGELRALMRDKSCDVLVLDINLPDMDGYEVLRRLREHPDTAAIPVVAVSANAMPQDLERGQAAGFAAYLTKPLDVARLVQVVDALVRSR